MLKSKSTGRTIKSGDQQAENRVAATETTLSQAAAFSSQSLVESESLVDKVDNTIDFATESK
jgi:hypothetical protein